MAEVVLEDIVKRFGKVTAVDHVNLRIGSGEFFVLLGPSGCGKTTTLRIIAGLEFPDSGRVIIEGEDVTFREPKERDIAMVFQNYALYPHMTVFDNIAFPLRVRRKQYKLTEEEIRDKVREVAELLKISDLLNRKPGQISGGQQQRVALARALVRRPKVWLMDEPLSNLDALLRVAMRAELKNLQRKLGITTVYVTHDQAEAMGLADRIAVMNKGRVIQVGAPGEVYHRPTHLFVATFIGSPPSNVVECRVEKEDNGIRLDCDGLIHTLRLEGAEEAKIPQRVLLAIRPEHITLSKEPRPGSARGTVVVVEHLGSETIVTLQLDSGRTIKAKIPGEAPLGPEENVFVTVDWRRASIFEPDSQGLVRELTRLLEETS